MLCKTYLASLREVDIVDYAPSHGFLAQEQVTYIYIYMYICIYVYICIYIYICLNK